MLENTKRVIRNRNANERQQKWPNDKGHKNKEWPIKYYAEYKRLSNMGPTKTREIQVLRRGSKSCPTNDSI